MTNAPALNAEATPYIRLRIHRKMRRITGWKTSEEQSRGQYAVHIRGLEGPASSVQALINTNTRLEMLEVAEKKIIG
jgi:hypothetical protein